MDFLSRFKAYRRISTPLLAITTTDQTACVRTLQAALPKEVPLIAWDFLQGMLPLNPPGQASLAQALVRMGDADGPLDQKATTSGVTCLQVQQFCAPETICFLYNAHPYIAGDRTRPPTEATIGFAQGLANLRDPNKDAPRMTVLLGPD